MSLTDTLIRQTKPQPKPIKLFDGRDLFLLVMPTGSRCWRLKYRFEGGEKLLALGVYPNVPLRLACDRREEARRHIRSDRHEWLALQEQKLVPATFKKAQWTFERLLFPRLGNRPIAAITAPDLLATLRKIEERGTHETKHRAKQRCGQIFR